MHPGKTCHGTPQQGLESWRAIFSAAGRKCLAETSSYPPRGFEWADLSTSILEMRPRESPIEPRGQGPGIPLGAVSHLKAVPWQHAGYWWLFTALQKIAALRLSEKTIHHHSTAFLSGTCNVTEQQ